MLVHLCLFVLLSLMSRIVYICKIIFEQINDDDDDDDYFAEIAAPQILLVTYLFTYAVMSSNNVRL